MVTREELEKELRIERALYNNKMEKKAIEEKLKFYKEKNKVEKNNGFNKIKDTIKTVAVGFGKVQSNYLEKDKRQGLGLF